MIGPNNPKWKGGCRTVRRDGYVMVYARGHPCAHKSGMAFEHRVIVSDLLGRPLKRSEIVHHKNGNPSDNRPENLVLMSQGDHCRVHFEGVRKTKPLMCKYCSAFFYPNNKRQLCCSHTCGAKLMHAEGRGSWKDHVRPTRVCGWCEVEFTTKRTAPDAKCCSRSCGQRLAYAAGTKKKWRGGNKPAPT